MKMMMQPAEGSSVFNLAVKMIGESIVPAIMIGLFYYNITEWIGDKTCFVN